MYRSFIKRLMDVLIVFLGLLIFLPILLGSALWLHFANKGAGAFFFQERPGRHGKIFKVIKFKTMTDERDAEGNLLPDDRRLTKIGKQCFERRYVLDWATSFASSVFVSIQ